MKVPLYHPSYDFQDELHGLGVKLMQGTTLPLSTQGFFLDATLLLRNLMPFQFQFLFQFQQ